MMSCHSLNPFSWLTQSKMMSSLGIGRGFVTCIGWWIGYRLVGVGWEMCSCKNPIPACGFAGFYAISFE